MDLCAESVCNLSSYVPVQVVITYCYSFRMESTLGVKCDFIFALRIQISEFYLLHTSYRHSLEHLQSALSEKKGEHKRYFFFSCVRKCLIAVIDVFDRLWSVGHVFDSSAYIVIRTHD